jgi:alpha-tubulin suppressor-like RCC1 family protein
MTVVKSEALIDTGSVWIWGDNGFGQQCDGTNNPRLLPAKLDGLDNVVTITGGGGQGVVLLADRTVWAWGRNDHGQVGDGTNENRAAPAKVEGLEDIAILSGGGGHTLALANDGTVWAWGHNGRGDLGDGTSDSRNRPVKVKDLTDVSTIAWGGGHSVAMRRDGSVWTWGHNLFGGLGDGTTETRLEPVRVNLDGVVEVAGGGGHTLAKTADGKLWAWGRNDRGQVGDGSNETRLDPVQVKGLDDVKIDSFIGGYFHSLVLATDGTIWAWGNNDSGQLGDGTTQNRNLPAQVADISGVKAIAGGGGRNEFGPGGHTVALLEDGTLRAWGLNDAGQLGDGTTENRTHPVRVRDLIDVKAIVAGGGYTMALA